MDKIGALKGEAIRPAAWERFTALPWPSKTDEEWRRTDPAKVPLGEVELSPDPASLRVGWEEISPKLIASGVILTDLVSAKKQFPELIQEYLMKSGAPEGLAKFVALHEALFSQGLFCYVPEGVSVELPLRSWVEIAKDRAAVFPHGLIIVGEGAEATLVDERRAPGGVHGPIVSDEMVEIFLKAGSRLRYVHLQKWPPQVVELFTQRVLLEKDAHFLNLTMGLGSTLSKANVETTLTQTGARADLLGLFFGSGRQHFDFQTLQDHRAQATTSDLLYKSALKDDSDAVYRGLIRIARQAQKSDAYQANRNLLLSQGAKADSIPMLEILADDVRCTHGVAVGPVDEEQAFYLMSRGVPEAEAERLIVGGFFEQVIQRLKLKELEEGLMAQVSNKMNKGDPKE
ncbi:MAG: Fe-S cluster assembly protein SufD [Candidatus Omnitrophica bacterium]|nr:Fe-S cluster assembly protein SufD [Candidatus Omnitrophota bacterium]